MVLFSKAAEKNILILDMVFIKFCMILYMPYISRGFYFREFRESGAIREFINTQKYLPPIPTHECDLCTQYIALLDREFNHSRKCLKVPIREKLDSRNIWRIQYYSKLHLYSHIYKYCAAVPLLL